MLANRVARLERQRAETPLVPCQRCAGQYFGYLFTTPGPGNHEPGPPGSPPPPLPPQCPECGRQMPKLWELPARADYDALAKGL